MTITCGIKTIEKESKRLNISTLVVPAGARYDERLLNHIDWLALQKGDTYEIEPLTLAGQLALSCVVAA